MYHPTFKERPCLLSAIKLTCSLLTVGLFISSVLFVCWHLFRAPLFAESYTLSHLLIWVLESGLPLLAGFELQHESEINCVLSRVELTACAESYGRGALIPVPIPPYPACYRSGGNCRWRDDCVVSAPCLCLLCLSGGECWDLAFVCCRVPFRLYHSWPL